MRYQAGTPERLPAQLSHRLGRFVEVFPDKNLDAYPGAAHRIFPTRRLTLKWATRLMLLPRSRTFLLCGALLGVLTGGACADVLELVNGDRISGVLKAREGETVVFESAVLGLLRVPAAQVKHVNVDPPPPPPAPEGPPGPASAEMPPVAATTTESTAVQQAPTTAAPELATPAQAAATAVPEGPQKPAPSVPGKRLSVPSEATIGAHAHGANTGKQPSARNEEDEEEEEDRRTIYAVRDWIRENIVPPGWSGKVTFGFSQYTTTSRKVDLNLGMEARRQIEAHHFDLFGYYTYASDVSTTGVKTVNTDKYGFGTGYQWDFEERWFLKSSTSYGKDMLRNIRHQVQEDVGVGYRIWNSQRLKINVISGPSLRYVDSAGLANHWYWLASITETVEYHFSDVLRFEHSGSYNVNPARTNQYSTRWRLGAIVKVTDWVEAALRYENSTNTIVGPFAEREEERIVLALAVPF